MQIKNDPFISEYHITLSLLDNNEIDQNLLKQCSSEFVVVLNKDVNSSIKGNVIVNKYVYKIINGLFVSSNPIQLQQIKLIQHLSNRYLNTFIEGDKSLKKSQAMIDWLNFNRLEFLLKNPLNTKNKNKKLEKDIQKLIEKMDDIKENQDLIKDDFSFSLISKESKDQIHQTRRRLLCLEKTLFQLLFLRFDTTAIEEYKKTIDFKRLFGNTSKMTLEILCEVFMELFCKDQSYLPLFSACEKAMKITHLIRGFGELQEDKQAIINQLHLKSRFLNSDNECWEQGIKHAELIKEVSPVVLDIIKNEVIKTKEENFSNFFQNKNIFIIENNKLVVDEETVNNYFVRDLYLCKKQIVDYIHQEIYDLSPEAFIIIPLGFKGHNITVKITNEGDKNYSCMIVNTGDGVSSNHPKESNFMFKPIKYSRLKLSDFIKGRFIERWLTIKLMSEKKVGEGGNPNVKNFYQVVNLLDKIGDNTSSQCDSYRAQKKGEAGCCYNPMEFLIKNFLGKRVAEYIQCYIELTLSKANKAIEELRLLHEGKNLLKNHLVEEEKAILTHEFKTFYKETFALVNLGQEYLKKVSE